MIKIFKLGNLHMCSGMVLGLILNISVGKSGLHINSLQTKLFFKSQTKICDIFLRLICKYNVILNFNVYEQHQQGCSLPIVCPSVHLSTIIYSFVFYLFTFVTMYTFFNDLKPQINLSDTELLMDILVNLWLKFTSPSTGICARCGE